MDTIDILEMALNYGAIVWLVAVCFLVIDWYVGN
jgi:hypothetical protein